MKKISIPLCFLAALAWPLTFLPLRAQYNPPPPPEEQQGAMNQAPPPGPNDQGAPGDPNQPPPADPNGPSMDQGAAPPDGGAPPMDGNGPPPGPDGSADQGAPPPDAQGDDQGAPAPDDAGGSATFDTFYNNLSSQGNWVQTDTYGYVWQPNENDPDWAPYTNGHWVYSDEGWAWVADPSEPWGWATYHYGRWINLDGTGWVWVPGYTWAPAWVSWRYGGGYCGWAPLPPATFVGVDFGGVGFGFHIGGDCDTAYGIGPGYYHFLPVGYIGARDYRGHYADPHNNFTIINNTRNVTNIVVNSQAGAGHFGRVRVGGPTFAAVNAQSQTPVQRVTLARSGQVGNARLSGNRLAVFAPHVAAAPAGARPPSVAGRLTTVQVNRGTNINQPLAVNARVRPAGPSAAQVQAAQAAQAHAATARVATVNTRPTQTLSRPVTSYQPHPEGRTAGTVSTTASHAAANSGARPESAFTGETASHENAAPHVSPGFSSSEVHHAGPSEESSSHAETHQAAPEAEHASAPTEHHTTESFHPQAEPRPSAPEERHEEAHAPAAPHPSAPPPHADAHGPGGPPHAGPAAHPGGGGPKKDDKDHHP